MLIRLAGAAVGSSRTGASRGHEGRCPDRRSGFRVGIDHATDHGDGGWPTDRGLTDRGPGTVGGVRPRCRSLQPGVPAVHRDPRSSSRHVDRRPSRVRRQRRTPAPAGIAGAGRPARGVADRRRPGPRGAPRRILRLPSGGGCRRAASGPRRRDGARGTHRRPCCPALKHGTRAPATASTTTLWRTGSATGRSGGNKDVVAVNYDVTYNIVSPHAWPAGAMVGFGPVSSGCVQRGSLHYYGDGSEMDMPVGGCGSSYTAPPVGTSRIGFSCRIGAAGMQAVRGGGPLHSPVREFMRSPTGTWAVAVSSRW